LKAVKSLEIGPITVAVSDKELQVLLINQRSLYILAQTKWSCMEMVAQWLATRITIKKVKVLDNEIGQESSMQKSIKVQAMQMETPQNRAAALKPGRDASPVHELIEHDATMAKTLEKIADDDAHSVSVDGDAASNAGIVTTGGKFIDNTQAAQNAPVLLDLTIDRRVEIPKAVQAQWKCRNIPVIAGMRVKLRSWQDLELLHISVTIFIPHPRLRKDTSSSEAKLIDYSQLEDGVEDIEEYFDKKALKPIEITVSFQLSSFELSVFGCTEPIEDKHVSLSGTSSAEHPATFMWNVISRLHLIFKVCFPSINMLSLFAKMVLFDF
jgi:hypothetical protein